MLDSPKKTSNTVVELPHRAEAAADPFHDGRRISRAGIVLIVLAFGGLGGWAALAPLNGAVIVPGQIRVDSYRKTVQHLEGGIVKEILVRPGDHVKKDQPLIVLEDVQASAMVDVLRNQLDALLARGTRLLAEKRRLTRLDFPADLAKRAADPRVAVILKAETGFFQARRKLVDGQAELLRTQIKQTQEEIAGLTGQVKSADENIAYLKEEQGINESLYDKKFVAYTRLLTFKRAVAEKEEKRGEYLALIAQAKQKTSELNLRIASLYDNYAKEATDELKEVEKNITDIREKLRPSQDALKRQTITAPIAGEVVDLKVHTTGGVIAPREPLMDIVPQDSRLIVEGKVRVDDITEVSEGKEADVQLNAFKQRTTPKVAGKVTYVSADALVDNTPAGPMPYYQVYVEVDRKSLREIGDLRLAPGMPATAFIKTRARTPLEYLLQPITDTLRKAMREK